MRVRGRVSWLLCTFVLAFAAAQSPAETTIYVGKHFEVREHDAPVKYVFNGSTRVARVTGSLSTNERIQRLRLRAGWNLVSLAVTAPDFLSQLEEFTSGPVPVIQALYRWQPATSDYGAIASGESVPAGTVLWLSAQADAVVAVRGGYVEPSQWGVPGGDTFVAVPALEAQPLQLPAGVTVWRYDAPNRRWQAGLTGDLASVSDLPSTLAPGEAIYVHSNEPTDLGVPAPEERIRYYHHDHLGSSSVMTDADGTVVEEAAFYPFGIQRHEHRLRQVEESYKFTQKERDRESGLHYFEARYLTGGLARFMTQDPKYTNPDALAAEDAAAFLATPQTMNMYAYAGNNPLSYVDPTGLDVEGIAPPPMQDEEPSTFMKIMNVGATVTTGFCDKAFGCGMGGYQVTRSIVVQGYNVDEDSTLFKGAEVAGFLTSLAVPVGGAVNALRGGRVAVTVAGEGGAVATGVSTRTVVTQAGTAATGGANAGVSSGIVRVGAARTANTSVAGGGGVFATTAVPSALADTFPGASALIGGLSKGQISWIQRVANSTGLAEAKMAAHAAKDYAAMDRISSAWEVLFRTAKYIKQ